MKIRKVRRSHTDIQRFFNGSFKESFNALVTSDGATITMTLTNADGSNSLTCQFSDGLHYHATPSTCPLVGTSNSAPTTNYVYILKTDPTTLVCNQTGFPTTLEHIKVGFFFVPSATYVASDGVYVNQNWNDHLMGTDNQGHMVHMAERSRRDGAYYFSGLDPNGTDNASLTSYFHYVGAAESYFKATAGVIYQMHRHTIPVIDSTPAGANTDIHIVNQHADNGGPYFSVHNIAAIVEDSTSASLSNSYFNLFFFAVGNKSGEYSPIMCKLPSGKYVSAVSAKNDVDGYDDLTMPREFGLDSSTGVPICRMTLRWTGGTSTLTHISTLDLRTGGAVGGGGGTGSAPNFADNQFTIFDEADITRIITVNAGNITTGNTRILTMADAAVDLADVALNNTHRTSDGSDHTFIDQSVVSGSNPTFSSVILTGAVDPDVSTEGQIAWDSDDDALRGFDGTNQVVIGQKIKTISFSIQDPENLKTHAGRSTQSFLAWYNDTGFTFNITKIIGNADEDNYTFLLFKSSSQLDIGTGTDTQIDSVVCEDNGTSCFYKEITSGFDSATIETGKWLIFEHSSGTAESVSNSISGWFDANVA